MLKHHHASSTIVEAAVFKPSIIGWDVGGAHLKAALLDQHANVLQVVQVACPLWRGLHELVYAIAHIRQQLILSPDTDLQHAVTMTGELADIFADRHTGVLQISALMRQQLQGSLHFYAGTAGFVDIAQVMHCSKSIASANWLASASFAAQAVKNGLFIDIGSSTADFVLISESSVKVRGYTDAERMQNDELVYSGVVRTPLMALASHMPFAGEKISLAAEHFATTGDVYRLTGDLQASADMADTADGAAKTLADSARRLARMVGHDADDAEFSAWETLAHAFKQVQLNQLKDAALRCLSRNMLPPDAPIVGAGAGAFLVKALALQLNRPYVDAAYYIKSHQPGSATTAWAAICLPAYAVAALAMQSLNGR